MKKRHEQKLIVLSFALFLLFNVPFILIFNINGNVFGGVGLRGYNSSSLDAMSITAGLSLGRHYRLSYSYDIGLSELKRVNEGSHEILLNYNLKKMIGLGNTPKVEYNPRNL